MIPPTYGGHQDPVRLSQARVGSVSTFRALTAAWRTSPGPPDYAYTQSALVPQGKAYFPASPIEAEAMGRRAGIYLTPIQPETGLRHHLGQQQPENLLSNPCSRTRYTGVATEPHQL